MCIIHIHTSSALSFQYENDHITRKHVNQTKSADRMSVIFTRQVTTLNAAKISHHSFSLKIHHTVDHYTVSIRDSRQIFFK